MTRKIIKLGLIALLTLVSCEQYINKQVLPRTREQALNKALLGFMQKYYYWVDMLPPDVDFMAYESPTELMEVLRYRPIDKWSYVSSRTENDAYFNGASYAGFGYASGFDEDGNYIISYVYPKAPMRVQHGIDRGWRILAIDGQKPTPENVNNLLGPREVGVSRLFSMLRPQGDTVDYTLTKTLVETTSILKDTVLNIGGSKVGYLALSEFVRPTEKELVDLFFQFKATGINELVVDLRYNGGGLVNVSNTLANLMGGSKANGQIYCTFNHNRLNQNLNEHLRFRNMPDTSLTTLNRVAFITSSGTASASELLINGLKPFMDVVCVGSRTHGKPVGMYTFSLPDPSIDWVFVPICFSAYNANGYGDFFDGLPVDVEANDDIAHSFGSPDEACMAAVLTQLGLSSGAKRSSTPCKRFMPLMLNGLDAQIGAK